MPHIQDNPFDLTAESKLIFLDVDGVLNSRITFTRARTTSGIIGIDPYLTILVDRILQATGAKVVLSSSWRHSDEGMAMVNKAIPLIDKTPSCCTGIRGAEIYAWMSRNVPYEISDEVKYAIIDDESDMLIWQKDNFFQTSFETGITEEIAQKIINHLK